MNKQVTNLLNSTLVCHEILQLLLREELIEPGNYNKLDHIELTKKAKLIIKAEMESGLSKEQAKEYIRLWPVEHQCAPGAVQKAYLDMLNNLDKEIKPPTFEELLNTVKLHLQYENVPYCGMADNFLYKNKKSRCVNRLFQLRSKNTIVKPVSFSTDM